jgi:hypothetical protein
MASDRGLSLAIPERSSAATDSTAASPRWFAALEIQDATARHPEVREWLTCHPCCRFHSSPASTRWRDAVDGFLAKLARRALERSVLRSVADLRSALDRCLAETDSPPSRLV